MYLIAVNLKTCLYRISYALHMHPCIEVPFDFFVGYNVLPYMQVWTITRVVGS